MAKLIASLFLLFLWFCVACGSCSDITVDLFSYQPSNNNVYQKFTKLTEDKTKIKIDNISDDVGFFIIQIHSHIENVTLSYNKTLSSHSYITGTNIGLMYGYGESTATFYVLRYSKVDLEVPIMLIVTLYDSYDPVPGGCNLIFDNVFAPYQVLSFNEDYITVDSQPPFAYGYPCDDNSMVEVDMYHMFLGEYDNRIETYFDGIRKMITVDDIKLYGRKVPKGYGNQYHKLYSSYRGTGEVFAIIATVDNRSSAYVPAVSYGCELINWNESCMGPVTVHWKVICAALLIFGMFVCLLGHRFFRFTLYVIGFTFGVVVTYFAVSFDGHFSGEEKTVTSLILGFFYGVIWVFIWWKYGIPILSVQLNFILTGILVASVVFYAGLADVYIYNNDLNFWVTFVCIILACLIIWIPASMYGHVFGCSILGSYACITALNYYFGGNLEYILINTFRRATVKYFNNAVIDPPFQIIDIIQCIAWLILAAIGIYVQLRNQKEKPPFPPHRNGVHQARPASERTPLITAQYNPETVAPPQYV